MPRLAAIGLLAFALTAGPSAACDPEEMIKELRAQCREAIEAASTLIDPVKSDLSVAERASIEGRLTEAGKLCDNDKYTDGFLVAAKVVRFAGAQRGGAGPLIGHASSSRRILLSVAEDSRATAGLPNSCWRPTASPPRAAACCGA
jgi:hypothetical protein